jgi:hypothetical protein
VVTARALAVCAAVAVMAGCGGAAGTRRGPGDRAAGPAGPRALILYRDGAVVRERHDLDVVGGRGVVAVPLPRDVVAGELVARVIGDGARVGLMTMAEPSLQPGDEIEVHDARQSRTISGTLRWLGATDLVIESADGVRVVLDPRHVIRGGTGGGIRRVELEVLGDRDGRVTVEVVYTTRLLSWRADYTLVMDAAVKHAQLHGSLGIDNRTAVRFDDARITLVDAARPTRLTAFDRGGRTEPSRTGPVADPTKPRGEQPVKQIAPTETPQTTLPFAVDVVAGAQAVSLLAGSHRLPARQTLVYDPVGDDRNHPGATPTRERDHGLDRKGTAVSQSIDVDMVAGRVPTGLPAGTVRLLERSRSGELSPLGESRIFERTTSDSDATSPTTSVAVGRATSVEGKRSRREYSVDDDAKRLVEEFVIELSNQADHDIEVIVREHMYRGKNWTLSYQSADSVAKEGEQKIAMRQRVPAKGKAQVVYRVVYFWP